MEVNEKRLVEKNPTVLKMVESWLKEHGYDGLYDDDCGCGADDLAPCCHINENCRAGYNQGPHDGYDYWIGPEYTIRCPHCNAVCPKDAAECLECGAVWG